MKQPIDLARHFLALADRDIKTFNFLVNEMKIADESVGFHAQQAIEKCLKAVLVFHSIEFRKTHDIRELLDLLTDHNLPAPPEAIRLTDFNRFAVTLRYEFMRKKESLDRVGASRLVEMTRHWAETQINEGDNPNQEQE